MKTNASSRTPFASVLYGALLFMFSSVQAAECVVMHTLELDRGLVAPSLLLTPVPETPSPYQYVFRSDCLLSELNKGDRP